MVITGPASAKPGRTVRFTGSVAACEGTTYSAAMNGADVTVTGSHCSNGTFWFECVVPECVEGELNLLQGTVKTSVGSKSHTVKVNCP